MEQEKKVFKKCPRRVELTTPAVNDLRASYWCPKLMGSIFKGTQMSSIWFPRHFFFIFKYTSMCVPRCNFFVGQKFIGKKLRPWEALAYLGFSCFSNTQPKEENNKSPTMSRIIIVPYFVFNLSPIIFCSVQGNEHSAIRIIQHSFL